MVEGVLRRQADEPRGSRRGRQSRHQDCHLAHRGKPLRAWLRRVGGTSDPRRLGQISTRAIQPERHCEPAGSDGAARHGVANDPGAQRIYAWLRRVLGARSLGPRAPPGRGRRRSGRSGRGSAARYARLGARRSRARLHPVARRASLARQRQRESEGRTGSPESDAHASGEGPHHRPRRRERRRPGRGRAAR